MCAKLFLLGAFSFLIQISTIIVLLFLHFSWFLYYLCFASFENFFACFWEGQQVRKEHTMHLKRFLPSAFLLD